MASADGRLQQVLRLFLLIACPARWRAGAAAPRSPATWRPFARVRSAAPARGRRARPDRSRRPRRPPRRSLAARRRCRRPSRPLASRWASASSRLPSARATCARRWCNEARSRERRRPLSRIRPSRMLRARSSAPVGGQGVGQTQAQAPSSGASATARSSAPSACCGRVQPGLADLGRFAGIGQHGVAVPRQGGAVVQRAHQRLPGLAACGKARSGARAPGAPWGRRPARVPGTPPRGARLSACRYAAAQLQRGPRAQRSVDRLQPALQPARRRSGSPFSRYRRPSASKVSGRGPSSATRS